MLFNRSKKYYFKGDSSDSDSSNGMIVESFLCELNSSNYNVSHHTFQSDMNTLLGASVLAVKNDSEAIHFSLKPHLLLLERTNGVWTFGLRGLNETVETPTDVAPISEYAGATGDVTLRVLLFGLIN